MSDIKRTYGWRKQPEDKRDFIYSAPKAILFPKKVDLRLYDSPIEDQGAIGSCSACATTSALQFLEIKDSMSTNHKIAYIQYIFRKVWRAFVKFWVPTLQLLYSKNLSRLFVYYNSRLAEGTQDQDAGAVIRDVIKTLVDSGVCMEKEWPYLTGKFTTKPPDNCYKDALNHQVQEYRGLTTLDDMKACLAAGYPFIFGISVFESFENGSINTTGIATVPDTTKEEYKGGHALLCVGYDDDKQLFLIRNSWGTDWSINKGYFYLPYAYITANLASDFWMITKAKNI